ncbi:MAG TPA: carboxypeptidase regulatory-like domain-containing protein [Kofleriaceae bacterium]|jgi:hypothetical protein
MRRGVGIGGALCIAAVVAFFVLHRHRASNTDATFGRAGSADTTTSSSRNSRKLATQPVGRRIAGVVIGEDDRPIAGAHVQLASKEPGPRAPMIVTTADGAFDFGLKPPREYVVFADAAKLTGAVHELDLVDPNVQAERLRIVLHACDTTIHGVVRDTVGGTVTGALVSRTASAFQSATGAISDATGAYELCIPTGGADLRVSADGYATVRARVSAFGRTLRDFVLAPGATVTGKVVRASDKTPVESATVELREDDGSVDLVGTSNADGTFTIDGALPGRHVAVAYVGNLVTLDPPEVAIEIGAPNEVTCEVSATPSVSGRLVLASDEKVGVPGVEVYLGAMTGGSDDWRAMKSASDGTFLFEGVRPGDYMAMVHSASQSSAPPVHVASADVSGLVLTTEAPSSVSGRVLYEGKPVEGADVRARSGKAVTEATTDSEGKFAFEGLLGEDVQLYAQSDRLGAFTNGPTVPLAKGEKKIVDVTLDLAASVAGIVIDQNNQPVPGVFVRFSLLHGSDFGQATTADDGSFAARAMSGGGQYVYEVTEHAESQIVLFPVEGKRFPPVTVENGHSHVIGLRVKIKRERLTIRGRVVDATAAGVPDATVRAVVGGKGGSEYAPAIATTDQSGAYVLRDLSRGPFTLSASASRGESDEISVEAGATNATLTLKQLGNIDLTLDGFTDLITVVATPREHAGVYPGTRTGNIIHYRNVFPGPYTLEVYTQGDNWEDNSVVVTAGDTVAVTLHPRALGHVDGVLVDAVTKQPISDARCAAGTGSWKPVQTDSGGAFHLPTVVAGESVVSCWRVGYDVTNETVTVLANQAIHVDLAASPSAANNAKNIHSGISFENQLGDVMVSAVAPNSPGARAGVLVGDVVTKMDGEIVDDAGLAWAVVDGTTGPITLEIERGDKTLTLTVVRE